MNSWQTATCNLFGHPWRLRHLKTSVVHLDHGSNLTNYLQSDRGRLSTFPWSIKPSEGWSVGNAAQKPEREAACRTSPILPHGNVNPNKYCLQLPQPHLRPWNHWVDWLDGCPWFRELHATVTVGSVTEQARVGISWQRLVDGIGMQLHLKSSYTWYFLKFHFVVYRKSINQWQNHRLRKVMILRLLLKRNIFPKTLASRWRFRSSSEKIHGKTLFSQNCFKGAGTPIHYYIYIYNIISEGKNHNSGSFLVKRIHWFLNFLANSPSWCKRLYFGETSGKRPFLQGYVVVLFLLADIPNFPPWYPLSGWEEAGYSSGCIRILNILHGQGATNWVSKPHGCTV